MPSKDAESWEEMVGDLRLALDLAENFYDGTDYNFDRLAPDEQNDIIEGARLALTVLEGGEEMWWCVPYHEGAAAVSEPCEAGSTHDAGYDCRWIIQIPLSALRIADPGEEE